MAWLGFCNSRHKEEGVPVPQPYLGAAKRFDTGNNVSNERTLGSC